jgi:hypothetical protein
MHKRGAMIGLMFAGAIASAPAQWLNNRDPRTPRTKDGKPNLSAPVPRGANGKPDLSGIWMTDKTPRPEMERLFRGIGTFAVPGDDPLEFNKYFLNIMSDFKPEDDPIRPEFAPILKQRARAARDTPSILCLPLGTPWIDALPAPYKLVQTPGLTLMIHEGEPLPRQVFTDGRKPPPDPDPSWLGYSVGNWDKDTLAVDTVGFNDRTWLDAFGHPHSESLHVVERFRRRDFGHMDLQVTFEDPKVYTKPVTVNYSQTLLPDTDLLEYVCTENERSRAHLPN